MTKEKIKNLFDYIPLIILIISAIVLISTVISNNTFLLWKHIAGLIVLPVNAGLFFWKHKIAVLALGLTLLTGLLGFLSYSHEISISTFYINAGEDTRIPIFYGQLIFLLWFLVHRIISIKHYIGIGTKKYWKDLINDVKK